MNTQILYIVAIVVAAALDIAANLFLVKSEGFSRKGYGFAAIALVGLAFTCLAFATKGMDLSVAYAMWGGFGIIGTSLGGWALFGQKIRPVAMLGIVCLIAGIGILHIG